MQKIVNNLCQNLYNYKNYKNYNNYKTIKPINIQLVLDSGAFSGSYILGGLLYIKQLEKNNIVSVQKISGSSVGSLLGFLYFTDKLNIVSKYFKTIKKSFSQKGNLSLLKKILKKIIHTIPLSNISSLNDKLFISFFDVNLSKQIVLSTFNKKTLLNSLLRSSHIPFISDGNLLNNKKYIDGLYPYFFKQQKDTYIIFMNLWSYYHFDMFYIKNETNNDARILEGIIQTHHFFFHFYHKDTICKKSKLCFLYNTMTYYDLLLLYFRIYLLHFFVYIFHWVVYVLKFYGFEKDDNFKPNLLHQKWFHSIKQVIVNSISIICFYFLT